MAQWIGSLLDRRRYVEACLLEAWRGGNAPRIRAAGGGTDEDGAGGARKGGRKRERKR